MAAGLDGLQPEFRRRLELMMAKCGPISVSSGFRSNADQTRLFNASDRSGRMVAPPGRSNHERGEAADLSGNLVCAHREAEIHGLRFPMAYEPWHIERDDLAATGAGRALPLDQAGAGSSSPSGGLTGAMSLGRQAGAGSPSPSGGLTGAMSLGRPGTAVRLVEVLVGSVLVLMGLVGLAKALPNIGGPLP